MSNENNNPQQNTDGNWLDDVLGADVPKAQLSAQELASMGQELSAEQSTMDSLLDDDTDQQTITQIQDSVARELPTIPLQEQPTSRIPFVGPTVSVTHTVTDSPTVAIPVIGQKSDATANLGETRQFTAVTDEDAAVQQATITGPVVSDTNEMMTQQADTEQHGHTPVPPTTENREEPAKKTRPAPKKGYGLWGIPHILSTVIWLVLIVVIGVSLGRMLWVCCADLMAFGKPDRLISVTISAQDVKVLPDGTKEVDMDSISKKLGDAGLIEYPALFKFFAEITGKDQSLSPGDYTLNSYFDYNAMINAMSSYEKPREIVTVLIPEGYNCAQLFTLLEAHEVCTVEELEKCAANGDEELNDYWFLTDEIPWGEKYCLEGYLFPDTYDFYTNDDPAHVLNKMLSNFDARFTDKMKENLKNIESRYGLTLREVLIIASMVEEEAVGATKTTTEYEGYNIASVFYNRLENWDVPILGCDATVYYAMGDFFGTTEKLTAEHLATDSPYNTRKYAGLPPGPITNPGSYSMYAALAPNETEYYYYIYDPDQKCHILTKTEAEHNKLAEELGY